MIKCLSFFLPTQEINFLNFITFHGIQWLYFAAQEEITKAISQKPRMNEAGGRKVQGMFWYCFFCLLGKKMGI